MSKREYKGMPVSAPPYPPGPYVLNGQIFLLTCRGDEEKLRKFLPESMELTSENIVGFWMGDFKVAPGSNPERRALYNETIIFIQATCEHVTGNYAAYVVVSTDRAMAAGREIWGFPKRMGETKVEAEGKSGRIEATVTRHGVELVKASAHISEDLIETPSLFNLPWLNYKEIFAVDGSIAIAQITAVEMSVEKAEYRGGYGTIELQSGPADPLGELGPLEVVEAAYGNMDYVFPFGRVLKEL